MSYPYVRVCAKRSMVALWVFGVCMRTGVEQNEHVEACGRSYFIC